MAWPRIVNATPTLDGLAVQLGPMHGKNERVTLYPSVCVCQQSSNLRQASDADGNRDRENGGLLVRRKPGSLLVVECAPELRFCAFCAAWRLESLLRGDESVDSREKSQESQKRSQPRASCGFRGTACLTAPR